MFEAFLAVRMDLPKTFLTACTCPNGPAENIFEVFVSQLGRFFGIQLGPKTHFDGANITDSTLLQTAG